jgi:hypothetical protein
MKRHIHIHPSHEEVQMENGSTMRRRRALACLALWAAAGVAQARAPDGAVPGLSVRVTAIAHREFTGLEKSLMQACEKAALEKGFKASEKPDVELFVAVAEIPGGEDLLAVSLVTASKPPEKLVNFAGQNEVFYLVMDNDREKLPAEGKEVRRYASEEYIRQFGQVLDHRVFIIHKTRLAEETADAVEAVLSGRTFLR